MPKRRSQAAEDREARIEPPPTVPPAGEPASKRAVATKKRTPITLDPVLDAPLSESRTGNPDLNALIESFENGQLKRRAFEEAVVSLGYNISRDRPKPGWYTVTKRIANGTIAFRMDDPPHKPPAADESWIVGLVDSALQLPNAEFQRDEAAERLSLLQNERAQILDRALGKISLGMSYAEQIRRDLQLLADAARTFGASWGDIARAADITPQAAQRRWDPEARQRRNAYQKSRYRRASEDAGGRTDDHRSS